MSDTKIEITAIITRISSGEVKLTSISFKMIPEHEDFDKLGFRAAFDEFEGAVLERASKRPFSYPNST
jgi:hypothetical protein